MSAQSILVHTRNQSVFSPRLWLAAERQQTPPELSASGQKATTGRGFSNDRSSA
jgi:hypothetical protein